MGKFVDLTGMRFGRLTVIYRVGDKTPTVWHCVCDCGNEHDARAVHLKRGAIQSCGCLQRELLSNRMKEVMSHQENRDFMRTVKTKHGDSTRSRLYRIWKNMISRTTNKRVKCYKCYGGRGITVCSEWLHDYQSFKSWAIANGYSDDLTIDRINCDDGYTPNNCRWTTMFEQVHNRHSKGYIAEGR